MRLVDTAAAGMVVVVLIATCAGTVRAQALCSNGLPGVDAAEICCAEQCGTCGGSGCDGRPGGPANCCPGTISAGGAMCSTTRAAPCIMEVCSNGLPGVDAGEICCSGQCGTCGVGCDGRLGIPADCCSDTIRAGGAMCSTTLAAPCIMEELSIECKPDVEVFAPEGEEVTVTLEEPIAVPGGGIPPYTMTSDPNEDLVMTGTPIIVEETVYTVTDDLGFTAKCSVTLSILQEVCQPGDTICGDPHMQGLRGQKIDWSGVNGGWYSLVKDDGAELQINVRLTAPLPEEFPDRQLITGVSIMSGEHSVTIEVKNPYDAATDGCPNGISPCLANGGLRVIIDGKQDDSFLVSSRDEHVADGIQVSASNLPVECRQFGGDKIWARMYQEMLQGKRELATEESFETWILRFDHMAASDWCEQYISKNDLSDVQSTHAIFKIVTPAVTVRLNAGVNSQGHGELDWDGRVLPDLEFWQMDVGLHGLSLENELLSGILGETARPVLDEGGREVMEGYDAFRGTVEDYRVSSALGTDFALLHEGGNQE